MQHIFEVRCCPVCTVTLHFIVLFIRYAQVRDRSRPIEPALQDTLMTHEKGQALLARYVYGPRIGFLLATNAVIHSSQSQSKQAKCGNTKLVDFCLNFRVDEIASPKCGLVF